MNKHHAHHARLGVLLVETLHRAARSLQRAVLWLQIRAHERYVDQCRADGLHESLAMDEWNRQLQAMRVRYAQLVPPTQAAGADRPPLLALGAIAAAAVAAAVLLITLPTPARAEFLTGNTLMTQMLSDSPTVRAAAIGYVQGVHDATTGTLHCAPDGVTGGQVNDTVLALLQRVPQKRHLSADVLVLAALHDAFPCPNSQPKAPAGSRTL